MKKLKNAETDNKIELDTKTTKCTIIGLMNGSITISVEAAQMLTQGKVIKPFRKLGQFKLLVDEEILWRTFRKYARDF